MRTIRLIAVITIFILLFGCQKDQTAKPDVNTIKVTVSARGDITADGQPSSLDQLSAMMADLKKANGTVLYHREDPEGEPHPNAMKVMQLVADNQLPIRLCAKPDFSDWVDEKGVSHR